MRRKEVLELLQAKRAGAKSTKRALRSNAQRPRTSGDSLRVAEPFASYGATSKTGNRPLTPMAGDSFKISAVENLAATLETSVDDLLVLLGVAGRTAQRRRQEGELSVEESDRLYRIARIVHRAKEVLGSEEGARRWLKRPQAFFAGVAPLALLDHDAGAKAVDDQLGRIDHGIFA